MFQEIMGTNHVRPINDVEKKVQFIRNSTPLENYINSSSVERATNRRGVRLVSAHKGPACHGGHSVHLQTIS